MGNISWLWQLFLDTKVPKLGKIVDLLELRRFYKITFSNKYRFLKNRKKMEIDFWYIVKQRFNEYKLSFLGRAPSSFMFICLICCFFLCLYSKTKAENATYKRHLWNIWVSNFVNKIFGRQEWSVLAIQSISTPG